MGTHARTPGRTPRSRGRRPSAKRPARARSRAARAAGRAARPPSPPRVSTTADYAGRLARLAGLMRQSGVGSLLVTQPADVAYLTGFLGGESYLLAAGGRPVVISDFRYEEELEPVRAVADVHIRTTGLLEAAAAVSAPRAGPALGFQADHLTVADRDRLASLLPGTRLAPTRGLVASLRLKKDDHEVSLMRAATRIQERALVAVMPEIRAGRTELEIAGRLEQVMKELGSSQPGFPSIVAARAHGSLPHYRPGSTRLAAGRPVLVDWGAVYRGYQGDMTRTFSLGRWPAKLREVYGIVREAQAAAAAALAPGRRAHEIDAIARRIIADAGYGDRFGHGLGHGLGLTKEPPYLNPLAPDMVLEAGHAVTVEPGIYLPGVGGVRIEDLYVVTATGAENLCTLPKDIDWATL